MHGMMTGQPLGHPYATHRGDGNLGARDVTPDDPNGNGVHSSCMLCFSPESEFSIEFLVHHNPLMLFSHGLPDDAEFPVYRRCGMVEGELSPFVVPQTGKVLTLSARHPILVLPIDGYYALKLHDSIYTEHPPHIERMHITWQAAHFYAQDLAAFGG